MGQESGDGLAEWFWFKVFHEVTVKLSAGPKGWLEWLCASQLTCWKASSLAGCKWRSEYPFCGPLHRLLCVFKTWQLASPTASDPREKERGQQMEAAVFYDQPCKWHTFPSAVFCWTHRPSLIRLRGTARASKHQRWGSLRVTLYE